jgi:multidrug transporter EmrE-like cation transporter
LPSGSWSNLIGASACGPLHFLLATGILHVFYFECLQRGYRVGDLSIAYLLARGTGPLLSFGGAILVFNEHASRPAMLGALLVSFGILLLSGAATTLRDRTTAQPCFGGC